MNAPRRVRRQAGSIALPALIALMLFLPTLSLAQNVSVTVDGVVSRPLTVTDWSPSPSIGVYLDSTRTQPAPFFGGTLYLTAGTNYYLFDEEPAPPPGTSYPGAQWLLA